MRGPPPPILMVGNPFSKVLGACPNVVFSEFFEFVPFLPYFTNVRQGYIGWGSTFPSLFLQHITSRSEIIQDRFVALSTLHVRSGFPQLNDMLANLTDNHPPVASCC